MITRVKYLLTSILLLFAFCLNAQIPTYNRIKQIDSIIKLTITKEGLQKKDVLVVFDIDNTLLKSDQDLGGDLWYNWQRSNNITDDAKLSTNCLFDIAVPLLTRRNSYSLVEGDSTKAVFLDLSTKYTAIALTSRSPELRIDTERALASNNLIFKDTKFTSTYYKYDSKLSYANGIFMTTGQNKGDMLKQLLGAQLLNYKYIFFVDDGEKNIKNMEDAFKDVKRPLLKSFYYTRVEDDWKKYHKGESFGNTNSNEMKNEFSKFLEIYGSPDQQSICNCQK